MHRSVLLDDQELIETEIDEWEEKSTKKTLAMAATPNQFILNQLDDSINKILVTLSALFLAMIVLPILPILTSLSLKSIMIFEVILAVIGIWISNHGQQLLDQFNHLRSLPSLDGDRNR